MVGAPSKFCIVRDDGSFVAHPSGEGLGWTSDYQEAAALAESVGAKVYDAEGFAKYPVVAHHQPLEGDADGNLLP